MIKIAFDVMNNDYGVEPAISAVNFFIKNNKNFSFILVGDQAIINKYLNYHKNIKIIDIKKKIDKNKGITVIREIDNSMAIAINQLKQKKADVVISSGDSAIYLGMSTLHLKRLAGIRRPAFMSFFPTIIPNKKFLMADVGANLEVSSKMLVQWAKIGNIFSKKILGINKPLIGIVNVGHEVYKGKEFHKQAYKILLNDKNLHFKGFIEARELLNGVIDIAIVDGYAGNMILKTMEGAVHSIFSIIKSSIKSKLIYKMGASMSKGAFKKVKQNLDYRNVGSAWVIGLQGLVVKCHGSADKQSYLGAFNQVKIAFKNKIMDSLKGKKYE